MKNLGFAVASLFFIFQLADADSDDCIEEGKVRLVDGVTQNEGRVEICIEQKWGSVYICDSLLHSAEIICRELGSKNGIFVSGFDGGLGHIHSIFCTGRETRLRDCIQIRYTSSCSEEHQAGVKCYKAPECNTTDIKLKKNGHIEICLEELWGEVCVESWNYRDSRVMCQQLGQNISSLQQEVEPFTNTSISYNLHCRGNETILSECEHNTIAKHRYSASVNEAQVKCTNGTECNDTDVQLIGGVGKDDGNVQICLDGLWGSVCGMEEWDYKAARVVCRQLMKDGSYTPRHIPQEESRNASLLYYIGDVNCIGNESNLIECNYKGTAYRVCYIGAAVICNNRLCSENDIQLADGATSGSGLIEICKDGFWGPVCGRGWDKRDAEVACRQLHFNGLSYAVLSQRNNYFKSYHLNDVQCNGQESKLSDCISQNYIGVLYCPNSRMAAGVTCSNITCTEGSIRLVGGDGVSRGRVEYCYNATWHSVCADGWDSTGEEVQVICRALNQDMARHTSVKINYGSGTNPILPLHFECQRGLNSLADCFGETFVVGECKNIAGVDCIAPCHSIGYVNCSYCLLNDCFNTDFSCDCDSACLRNGECCSDIFAIDNCFDKECEHGTVRLVGGLTNSTGMLEICGHGVWGKVCNRHFGPENVRVVCNQLKFPNQYNVDVQEEGTSERLVVMADIFCAGTESELMECSHSPIGYFEYCQEGGDITIHCYNEVGSCNNGDVRLQSGTDSSSGHVVFCYDRQWVGVCGDGFDEREASVVCSQLKISSEALDMEISTVFMSRVTCTGSEQYFNECMHSRPPTGSCERAAVSCVQNSDQPSSEGVNNVGEGILGGVLAFLLLSALVGVGFLLLLLTKRQRRKRLWRMQLDIHAVPGCNTPALQETVFSIRGKQSDSKGSNLHTSSKNPYELIYLGIVSNKEAGESTTLVQQDESRTRVASFRMRELAKGKLLVTKKDITLMDCIGEGEFGIVYKGRLRNSYKEVAVKTLKGEFDQVEVDKFVEESMKMSRFKHSHVMGLIGVCLDTGSAPYIIMPYMANGSLLKYLRKERNNLVVYGEADEDEMKEVQKRLMVMCSQIASGMEYLAADKYVHRDLAARNCMINTHFLIKITDFGLSEDVFERNYFRQDSSSGEVVKLPIKWMAPESLSDGHFSEKSDVWSYGVTMWEIFSGGKAPYPGTDPLTLMQSLEQGHRMPQPYNTACIEEIYKMMMQCWRMSPEDRPTFKEICSSVSKFIERIAGYLEIGFNPFTDVAGGNKKIVEH